MYSRDPAPAAAVFDEIPGSDELSDCESSTTTTMMTEEDQTNEVTPNPFSGTGFQRVDHSEPSYKMMMEKFVSRLTSCGYEAQLHDVYSNSLSTTMTRTRFLSFHIFSRAVCGYRGRGNKMHNYAWFGASMTQIRDILHQGFSSPSQNGVLGHGIHLSPIDKPLNSILSAIPEANGLRCMLLCRVILGNSEVIRPGSTRWKPSSWEFDSGVDSLSSPATYVVWSSCMNTHILPEAVLIFTASPTTSTNGYRTSTQRIPFRTLLTTLKKSRLLPCDAMELIEGMFAEYKKKKITRKQMVERVRIIAGDELLIEIMKFYMGKTSCP